MIVGREGEAYVDALEEMEPIVSVEETDYGWRGLTAQGEVYEVRGSNGHKAVIPDVITVFSNGRPIGRRRITNESPVDIDAYLLYFNLAVSLHKDGKLNEALEAIEMSMRIIETLRSRFNRAMILLHMGRWSEGFREYWRCEQEKPFMRPQVAEALALGLKPWKGEPGRLSVIHAHGFGDTIMALRFVPPHATMVVPRELARTASQFGEVSSSLVDCDYFCPILHLLYHRDVRPGLIDDSRYVTVDKGEVTRWGETLGPRMKKRVGVAWSVGKPSPGDFPREIDLELLVDHLRRREDVEIHSVQLQGADEARECGVVSHSFVDFADCAALMAHMNEIVSVDTAAIHLAGAIGHPKVTGLLSHWHSWRWRTSWYRGVKMVSQRTPGDWSSALEAMHG